MLDSLERLRMPLPARGPELMRGRQRHARMIGAVFFVVLVVLMLLTGVIDILTVRGFRLSLVSLGIVPLLFFFRPVIDGVTVSLAGLAGTIALSAVANGSTLLQTASVMRVPVFAYLIYLLVYRYVKIERAGTILRILLVIAALQLPIVLLQWRIYPYLPDYWRQSISPYDIGVGTFGLNRDYSMSFLVTMMVIFLLFNKKSPTIVKHRWPLAVWLTLTVLTANSEILRINIILVWILYVLLHFRIRTFFVLMAIGMLLLAVSTLFATDNRMNYEQSAQRLARDISGQQQNLFLEGAYTLSLIHI